MNILEEIRTHFLIFLLALSRKNDAALDPSVEIWRVANPIILKGETRRRLKRVGRKIENTLVGDNRVLSKALGLETYLYS